MLGDPSLRLGLRSPDIGRSAGRESAYVDPAGQPLALPRPGSGASTTVVDESAGTPTVVLVHDATLEEDRKLLLAVSSSVRLCLRSTGRETTGIGSRLLQAADEERRRLERDLHDGAQTRLAFALMTLRRLDAGLSRGDERAPDPALRRTVAEADRAVRQALQELRDLARGIHPPFSPVTGSRRRSEHSPNRHTFRCSS
ncbi:histidine kinase [Streptomyces sp. G35A]